MTQSIAHFYRESARPCVSDMKGNQASQAGVFEVVKIEDKEYLRNISTEVEMVPRQHNPLIHGGGDDSTEGSTGTPRSDTGNAGPSRGEFDALGTPRVIRSWARILTSF